MSVGSSIIECMFDSLDEASLLAEMTAGRRAERSAVARRLMAAGRLCLVRMADVEVEDRTQWCIDNWEAVAAEVGAELGISRARASSEMNYGLELVVRLPKLGAAMAAGEVDFRVISVVVFRTGLIVDATVLALIDARLAAAARSWNGLSRRKIVELVDWRVRELDPAAERAARGVDEDRHVEITPSEGGLAQFWGAVRAADAAVLDRRLDALAGSVCAEDSRTKRQRRADALAVLAAGVDSLVCDCGSEQCPAAGAAAPAQVVIHVVAEAATVSGESATPGQSARPGYLPGFGAVAAETVRDLATRAHLRPLKPAQEFTAEPQYRPSTALAEFIRARDLWCRFPGCEVPAEFCDLDHSIPWIRGGPTHPSNLNCKCRAHHLLKTFWCGENGWAEQQYPDGTLVFTSPSGRTYTTTPGGALFFPQLATPTETLTAAVRPIDDLPPGRTLMMPTRKRTRAAERAARIAWERGLNEARWAADPPPF